MSSPSSKICPPSAFINPATHFTSSDCPFPLTPAIPTISPSPTCILRWSIIFLPSPFITRSFISKIFFSDLCGVGFFSTICLPTIKNESSAADVFSLIRSATTSPARITTTLSATSITSLSLCVIIIRLLPIAASAFMVFSRLSTSSGVKTADGSSKIIISTF